MASTASGVPDAEVRVIVKNKWRNLKAKKPTPEAKLTQANREYRKALADRLGTVWAATEEKIAEEDLEAGSLFFKYWNTYMPDFNPTEIEGKKAKEEHLPAWWSEKALNFYRRAKQGYLFQARNNPPASQPMRIVEADIKSVRAAPKPDDPQYLPWAVVEG